MKFFLRVLDSSNVDIDDLEPTAKMQDFYKDMRKEDLFEKILSDRKKTEHVSVGDLLLDEVPLLFKNPVKIIPDKIQREFKSELKNLLIGLSQK